MHISELREMSDVKDSDRPKWNDKYVNSYLSKTASYYDEAVHSRIMSEKSIDGKTVPEYEVSLSVVIQHSLKAATANGMVSKLQYKKLSSMVYNRLNFSMPDGVRILSSVKHGDGRKAVQRIRRSLGSERNQLDALEARMNSLNIDSVKDFPRFEQDLGFLLAEWALLTNNSTDKDIQREKMSEPRKRRFLMSKIQEVFPEIWRDASKVSNTDGFERILDHCNNESQLSISKSRPTSHFAAGVKTMDIQAAFMNMPWDPQGKLYPPAQVNQPYPKGMIQGHMKGKPKGKGGKRGGRDGGFGNPWDHRTNSWKTCNICGGTSHLQRYCANKGGPFEGNLEAAMNQKRADRANSFKGKGSNVVNQSEFQRVPFGYGGMMMQSQYGIGNNREYPSDVNASQYRVAENSQFNGRGWQASENDMQRDESVWERRARSHVNRWSQNERNGDRNQSQSQYGNMNRSQDSSQSQNDRQQRMTVRHYPCLLLNQSRDMETRKDVACIDSGCNEIPVFNDPAYLPFECSEAHNVEMLVADGVTARLELMGEAYFVIIDEQSGNEYPISMKRAAVDRRYPFMLIPETRWHFEEDGVTERPDYVNFKKNILFLDYETSHEVAIHLKRVEKLPCLSIRPLNAHEIEALRAEKGTLTTRQYARSLGGFHVNKRNWLEVHQSLGCPSDPYLKLMAEKSMVNGLHDMLPFPKGGVKKFCECYINEMHFMKAQIPQMSGRIVKPGWVEVSADIIGPWPVTSIHGETYGLIIKIKGKKHCSVYFMKRKNEVQAKFDQFVIDMEGHCAEIGSVFMHFDLLSTDNDTNFFNQQMNEWCRRKGVKQFSSAPYAKEFSSAEPVIKQIKKRALNMLSMSGFPQFLWTYMFAAAVKSLNHCYTETHTVESERFVNPHLRMFPGDVQGNDLALMAPIGCKMLVFVDSETRQSNDNYSYIGYYAGPTYNMKGFNAYSPVRRGVYEAWHVKFISNIFYKDEWGPQKKVRREIENEIVQMSKEDSMKFDQMEDGSFKEFVSDFAEAELGRSSIRSKKGDLTNLNEQGDESINLDKFDPDMAKKGQFKFIPGIGQYVDNVLQSPAISAKEMEKTTPGFTEASDLNPFVTPSEATRVRSEFMENIEEISPEDGPVRKSGRIEAIENQVGDTGFNRRQSSRLLEGVKMSNSRAKDLLSGVTPKAKSNSSLLMTMATIAIACGSVMSVPKATVLELLDAENSLNMGLSVLALESVLDVERYQNPCNLVEAFNRPQPEGKMWYEGAIDEMEYLLGEVIKPYHRNQFPKNAHILNMGWTLNGKHGADGKLKRTRARAFPKGCSQIPYLEFDPWKISSHTARRESIMIMLSVMVKFGWKIMMFDIRKAFFTSALKETILSKVPPGFEDNPRYAPYGPETVWLYVKNAYGLKQASYNFAEEYASLFISNGWKRLLSDVCVFYKKWGNAIAMFSLWVDDNWVFYNSPKAEWMFKSELARSKYEFTEEPVDYALGMNIDYNWKNGILELSNRNFLHKFFKMNDLSNIPVRSVPLKVGSQVLKGDCPESDRPDMVMYKRFRSILGGISHVVNWTHKECGKAVSMLSKVMANPGPKHMALLLELAGYLKGVADRPLVMKRNARLFPSPRVTVWAYCDSDYAGDLDTRRSTTGFCVFADGMLTAAKSTLQHTTALSTTQAEFMALVAVITTLVWMLYFYEEIGIEIEYPVCIMCDNQACIAVAKSADVNFKATKHIDVRYMFIKEVLKEFGPDGKEKFDVYYCKSEDNIGDLMTKLLPTVKFRNFRDKLLGWVIPTPERVESDVSYRIRDLDLFRD